MIFFFRPKLLQNWLEWEKTLKSSCNLWNFLKGTTLLQDERNTAPSQQRKANFDNANAPRVLAKLVLEDVAVNAVNAKAKCQLIMVRMQLTAKKPKVLDIMK